MVGVTAFESAHEAPAKSAARYGHLPLGAVIRGLGPDQTIYAVGDEFLQYYTRS